MRSSAPISGSPLVLASAEKHKMNLNTVLSLLISTSSTLGLRSIESATHNLAYVIPDTLSHFSSGLKSEEPPLVRGSHGDFESQMFSEAPIIMGVEIGQGPRFLVGMGFAFNNSTALQIRLSATTAAYRMQ